jgi:dihydroorotate dehydrogenase (fumarate)
MSINANGLCNHGLQYYLDYIYIKEKPYIISTVEPECVEKIDDTSICDLIEYNISCPNVMSAFVEESQQDEVLRGIVETTTLGVGLKVTALSTEESFVSFAEMVDRNGFKFVTSINSMPRGAIIEEGRPVVSMGLGGIGGLSILPFSIANIVCHKHYLSEKIDVIAAGGVLMKDHVAMFRALGASAVQVGTAFQDDINIFDKLM